MKKLAIVFACVAVAFAAMSCSHAKTSDPDSIHLENYDPYAESSCWALTAYSGSAEATEYSWTNEYWLAAGVKLALEVAQSAGADVAYSWHGVSASNEDACNAMNNN